MVILVRGDQKGRKKMTEEQELKEFTLEVGYTLGFSTALSIGELTPRRLIERAMLEVKTEWDSMGPTDPRREGQLEKSVSVQGETLCIGYADQIRGYPGDFWEIHHPLVGNRTMDAEFRITEHYTEWRVSTRYARNYEQNT